MIESHLDPAFDGTGCGCGNDPGLTVEQIADRFRYLAADRLPRSVSAILRILREQSKARASYKKLVRDAVGFTATAAFAWCFTALAPIYRLWGLFGNFCLGFAILTGIPAVLDANRLRRDDAQLEEIRRLALEALEAIVASPWFVPEDLDREEKKSFRTLRSSNPDAWTRVASILIGGDQ